MTAVSYRGRFAPSPTGPLHLGSLLAAAASFIDARQSAGEWCLRIDDIDPPREVAGAADQILRQLEAIGLTWDGKVLYQSTRLEAYRASVESLLRAGHAFRCSCSRSDIRRHGDSGPFGTRYPGTCRAGPTANRPTAVRVLTDSSPVRFDDRFQGPRQRNLAVTGGDYVIQRRGGLPAYHMAVVVDDELQGITDVVRGIDLLESTFAHCHLQDLLSIKRPRYGHVPILVNAAGEKLSKQTGAAAVPLRNPSRVVCRLLQLLGREPPADLRSESPRQIWKWAISTVSLPELAGRSFIALG